ncbi:uncharacterized protein [Porites lutea]|uniref:uncharacterized protein isoform X1 n=2 Tax=Porites lutea TaxID=51062 RepID=UPI003CC6B065
MCRIGQFKTYSWSVETAYVSTLSQLRSSRMIMDTKLFALLVIISATLPFTEGRECHHFDYLENCTTPACKTPDTCLSKSARCVVLYQMGKGQSKPKLRYRGCWEQDDSICSNTTDCQFHTLRHSKGIYKICCCAGNLCNVSTLPERNRTSTFD